MISRLANWILYAVILAVIGALIYYYTDWFKPATEKAMVAAKSVVESMPLGPFSKKEGGEEALGQAREAYARGDAEGQFAPTATSSRRTQATWMRKANSATSIT